ncbi:hypothetical protein [Helicobacter turcicus]|uniref:Periplasmic protein n=1 Tax=Helicobacter turcicus TaxID=2867412 RepID=A0ABS7JPB3_9HELI|nr:hypothetical protein [Helicobacter turcicus]MBX7491246.1 hypothetical protein [Helicobacter turcicus]MBX7546115.1 hypothetical protein [Helicobacter turcicus]
MFKTIPIICALTMLFSLNLNAISLDDMLNKGKDEVLGGIKNKVFENLDAHYKKIFEEGLSLTQSCFDLSSDINLNDVDFCAIADKLDNLKINACSIIGGSGSKNISVSGARKLCLDKAREFEDYASKRAIDVIENSILNTSKDKDSFSAKLPNGKSLSEFYKNWEVSSILKDPSPTNIVGNYLKGGDLEVVALFMEYARSAKGDKDINAFKIEDLKAPKSIEEYKKGIKENIETQRKLIESTNINNVGSLVKSKLNQSNNTKEAKEVVEKLKQEFDLAKNSEISYKLANANYKKIPIPTQEYIESFRIDTRPKLIAQIRKQQAFESAIIAEIEEKWNRKYELAKLIADKEMIMAQEFDRESAKAEIEKIVANAGSESGKD